MRAWLAVMAALISVPGCAQGGFDDAGPAPTDAGVMMDAGAMEEDAGRFRRDAGGTDAGPIEMDAGPGMDAGPPMDGGPGMDAGTDAGPGTDAGLTCTPDPTNVEISEVMVASQTGSTDRGEWFEVHNLGACPVNLTGLVIDIGGATHTVTSGLLTAGGFFVFAQSGDAVENHMLGHDYVYGGSLRMSNSAGSIVLTHASTEVARVAWGATDHRIGRSRQLSNGASMPLGLGSAEFCDSTALYATVDSVSYLGTPGMINETCP